MGDIRRKLYLHLKMESMAWLSLFLAVLAFITPALASSPRVVCYYTNWSVYRPGTAKFNPQNINPYLCTHLVYAFGGFTKENSLKPFDKYQDIEKGGYAKFTGLKTYNKNLKTMLAIGGWNEGSTRFSPMVGARDRRKEFVRNAIKFLRQNHFDGLDLDWEYPAFRDGGKPKDRENYAKLVKELREEFEREAEKTGKPRLLLTMAVPAGIEYIQKGFDVETLNRYLDWMNLLTYDYHSAFEPAVNHHAPLFPLEEPNEYSVDNELNIDYTIKFYLENGADRDKLVLGIPTYGRSYTLFNPDAVEIGSPADGPGEQGDATREKGYLAYYEICDALKPKTKKRSIDSEEYSDEDSEEEEDEDWTIMHPNPNAMGPVAYKGNQWVGYDDIEIVKKKAEYVAENGLGGIMFWSIDNDDFRGNCHDKPYPLIEAAKEAYIVKLGSTDNVIVTEKPKSRSSNASRRRSKPRSSSTTTTTTTTTPRPTTTKSNKRKSSAVLSTTPAWNINTPEPPTTPDPGSDFKCKDEGFFPHPRDCKKYFWCLDSGPSNLGIVAHQFTCPSGLFFNKAADSCDFARNVLCKATKASTKAPPKPTTKATTSKATVTTTTTTTTTTTRRPSRLTSRSSLLFRTTSTTTPAPEVVDENEEEDDETVPEDTSDVDAEDPKVIKELIDLIKKVGGVEQLEKQLHLSETSASTGGVTASTTPSPFNKRLYQKVLERTRGKSRFGNSASANSIEGNSQNSRRAPQNAGLQPAADKDKLLRKDRPQYTTINRSRPSTTTQEPAEESEKLDEEFAEEVPLTRARAVDRELSVATTAKPLQYVNIRRARPTTAATVEADDNASRNALFDRLEPYPAVSETANALETANSKRESIPEYVTIRRSRPTTEETTTAQYQIAEHEEESQETALEREISSPSTQSQYTSIIRTRSTTLPPPEEPSSPEPTTILSVQISSLLNSPNSAEIESPASETTAAPVEPEPTTVSSTTASTTTSTTVAPPTTPAASSSLSTRRNLLRRRGSTSTTTTTTAPVSSTQAAKERQPFLRRTKATGPPDAAVSETTTDAIETTTNKYTKRGNSKFKTPKDGGKDAAGEKTRETGENETRIRQPSFGGSAARSDRPTRNFVRRRLGGANSSTVRSTSSLSTAAITRRPFRVASRRRPAFTSLSTTSQSTTSLSTTTTTTTTTQATIDLGSEELLQDIIDIGDIDSIEDPTLTTLATPRTPAKATRRPLVSLTEEDQNPSATNEDESKRQSKKYSATFKQNQLEQSLRQKTRDDYTTDATTEGKTTVEDISAETAVALAAHQLLAAPIPIVPDYDEVKPTKKTAPQTTLAYKYSNPEYTEDYSKIQTYTEEYTNTPSYNKDYGQTIGTFPGITNTSPTSVTDIFTKGSRPGYSTNLLNPTISGPQSVGVDGSTARYTGFTDTNEPTTYEYTTRVRPGYSANLITPTSSGVTINVGEEISTGRYTGTERDIPSTFPTLFTSKVSRPSGFTAPVTTPTNFRERSTIRYQVTSERLSPSTGRYQNSNAPIPVPVDFSYSTNGYSPSQEPSYFTREYLLESPVTKAYDDEYQYLSPITSPQTTPTTTATKPPKKKTVFRKISTTLRPTTPAQRPTTPTVVDTTTTLKPRRVATRKPFQKIHKTQKVKDENRTYRPIASYDYYDDSNEKMVDKYAEGTKVVLHGKDSIECLDIGNFPHPTSCKKFISCARIDNGSLLGWEYVCPKGLSFDPVGGICNWAAGLGCGEKDL